MNNVKIKEESSDLKVSEANDLKAKRPQSEFTSDPASLSSNFSSEDEKFMRMALRQAQIAFDMKEIPIGCVIVKDGVVIGKGYNQVEQLKDATAHAEIIAIGTAASTLDNWRLDGCTLYVTLEPCPMCAGAILNSRVSRIVYGSPDYALKRAVEVTDGVLADECLGLLKGFFQQMRLEKGDTGAKPPTP